MNSETIPTGFVVAFPGGGLVSCVTTHGMLCNNGIGDHHPIAVLRTRLAAESAIAVIAAAAPHLKAMAAVLSVVAVDPQTDIIELCRTWAAKPIPDIPGMRKVETDDDRELLLSKMTEDLSGPVDAHQSPPPVPLPENAVRVTNRMRHNARWN